MAANDRIACGSSDARDQQSGGHGETIRSIIASNLESDHENRILSLACMKQFTTLIFQWQSVDPVIFLINTTESESTPPFPIPDPLTSRSLKRAILDHIRDGYAPETDPIGISAVPGSTAQTIRAISRATALCYHPWIRNLCARQPDFRLGRIWAFFHDTFRFEPVMPHVPDSIWL